MTVVDWAKAYVRSLVQPLIDKEPVNYTEAAGLFGIILQGRLNISLLGSLYNQAQDVELKALIREAIEELMAPAAERCETLMRAGGGELPAVSFPPHPLYNYIEYPSGVRLSDREIAIAVANIARNWQLTHYLSLQQCYQLEIARAIAGFLTGGLAWDYRFLQLMLARGWLPHIAKVVH